MEICVVATDEQALSEDLNNNRQVLLSLIDLLKDRFRGHFRSTTAEVGYLQSHRYAQNARNLGSAPDDRISQGHT